jgi:hypothetical protein
MFDTIKADQDPYRDVRREVEQAPQGVFELVFVGLIFGLGLLTAAVAAAGCVWLIVRWLQAR